MIDNLSECKEAAEQLKLSFEDEEDETYFPGGCYVNDPVNTVRFNKNLKGASEGLSKPICGQGKYDKYISQFSSFDTLYK